ncbi:MAG: TadE/TadG family type IV pilus assembly protein [Alphaproteobacteria bacterium]
MNLKKVDMLTALKRFLREWKDSRDGVAALEATMIFPVLLILLLGTYDMGNGIIANQKTIRASQVAADLVTRKRSIDDTGLDEAIEASRLALEPYDASSYGIDIVSIRFDDDEEPEIVWRETRNMTPDPNVLADVASLADAGNGVVVVRVKYLFEPVFAGFIVDNIPMEEVAFSRGRKSPVVNKSAG